VGFEPTASAMPMPHPTGLDDRPFNVSTILLFSINTFNELQARFLMTTFSYLDKVYITSKDARQLNSRPTFTLLRLGVVPSCMIAMARTRTISYIYGRLSWLLVYKQWQLSGLSEQ
jgi:hypothetical protein